MLTTLQRASFPDGRRILMISDIHGHADGLRAILDQAHFSREDILVIVGDLVEKGPQSLKSLRLVMDLSGNHTVYPVMGNVDLWRLEYFEADDPEKWKEWAASSIRCKNWWGSSLLHEMCAEIGEELTPETDVVPLIPRVRERFAPEMDFIARMPTILETQRMIFVHGGIPHEQLDELVGTDAFPILKFDDFYNAGLSFQRYVVAGHTPAVLYSKTYPNYRPVIDKQRRIISLDGACGVKYEGQLNLLTLSDWRSDEFTLYTWDHLPVITALDAQASSDPDKARYIRWNDHAIELVQKGKEMSQVQYHGQPMDVPTQFIFDHNGVLSCTDTTDYIIETQPGDTLHLALRLSDRCWVKKNSFSGWYYGRYVMNEVN